MLIIFFLLPVVHSTGQSSDYLWEVPEMIYSKAVRVETLKQGGDCTVISYFPIEYNQTATPRDDRNLGVQYFVSGKDCQQLFIETFASFKGRDGEEFFPIPTQTLVLDSFQFINTVMTDEWVGDGCTKLFLTSFWHDHNTPSLPTDDLYTGSDFFIESADPSSISGPLDVAVLWQSYGDELNVFEDIPSKLTFIESHSYYKLKEMQVNRNQIVEQLRADGKWKDITPPDRTNKSKVKLKKIEF